MLKGISFLALLNKKGSSEHKTGPKFSITFEYRKYLLSM